MRIAHTSLAHFRRWIAAAWRSQLARHLLPPAATMAVILDREVLVFSNDGSVRSEVGAVVARRPGAHAVYAEPEGTFEDVASRSGIVVVDDEGRRDAVDIVHRVKARAQDAAVVYLAANHSTTLEAEVRRAGASFYAVKAARDGDLTRVIEVLLARSHG